MSMAVLCLQTFKTLDVKISREIGPNQTKHRMRYIQVCFVIETALQYNPH